MRRPTTPRRHFFSLRLRPELVALLRAESIERQLTVTALFEQLVADNLGGHGLPRPMADLLEQDRLSQTLSRPDYLRTLLARRYDELRAAQRSPSPSHP